VRILLGSDDPARACRRDQALTDIEAARAGRRCAQGLGPRIASQAQATAAIAGLVTTRCAARLLAS
jgi:hypothetical protein